MPREGNELVQRWPASQGKGYRNSNRTQGRIQSSSMKTPFLWPIHQTVLSQLRGLCLQAHQTQIKFQLARFV